LRELGYTVEEAIPASGDLLAVYVARRGDRDAPPPDDPTLAADSVLTYITEQTAGDYL
jgi:hypothetical protein